LRFLEFACPPSQQDGPDHRPPALAQPYPLLRELPVQGDARPSEPLRLHLTRKSFRKRAPRRGGISHSIRRILRARTLLRSSQRLRGMPELAGARPIDIQFVQLAMEITAPI
jgi:hypothetical protein